MRKHTNNMCPHIHRVDNYHLAGGEKDSHRRPRAINSRTKRPQLSFVLSGRFPTPLSSRHTVMLRFREPIIVGEDNIETQSSKQTNKCKTYR